MLFKSDFQPLLCDEDLKKKLLLLKLNDEYKDTVEKFRKQKEKEEEQRLREGKREKKDDTKEEGFIGKIIEEMTTKVDEKQGKIKAF